MTTWQFNKAIAEDFDAHVRKNIPLYDLVQNMVLALSEWYVQQNTTVYDIGAATGETIFLMQQKYQHKKGLKFVGLENSADMLCEARKKIQGPNIEFREQDITTFDEFSNPSLILSLYTFHFLSLKKRTQLLKRIHKSLPKGTAFILTEKILGEDALFEDIWLELYWDFKEKQGLSSDNIRAKARALRGVITPLSLSANISLLKEIGFTKVDLFFKWFNFAGIIALP